MNLLPQGSFGSPEVNTGWAEGFNIPNNQEFKVVSENGNSWLQIENRDAGRQLDYVHAFVKVTPEIASLTVSVRMKATNLKIGKEGWHTARVPCAPGCDPAHPAGFPYEPASALSVGGEYLRLRACRDLGSGPAVVKNGHPGPWSWCTTNG